MHRNDEEILCNCLTVELLKVCELPVLLGYLLARLGAMVDGRRSPACRRLLMALMFRESLQGHMRRTCALTSLAGASFRETLVRHNLVQR